MPDTRIREKTEPLNKPVMLSHGTITCKNLEASRRFYEEFLGLDVVQHTERGVLLRKGGYLAIVCLEVGEHVKPGRSPASLGPRPRLARGGRPGAGAGA
jgi:catechol 2,3-dioxygenase-like lactoylglutathione lyase family enzyme